MSRIAAILVLAACMSACRNTKLGREDALDLAYLSRPGIDERLAHVQPLSLESAQAHSANDLTLRIPGDWRVQKVRQIQQDTLSIQVALPTKAEGITITYRQEPGFIFPPMPGLTNQLARYIPNPTAFLDAFSNDCAFLYAAYNTTLVDLQNVGPQEAGQIKALLSIKRVVPLPVQHLATQHLGAFLSTAESKGSFVGLADLTDADGLYRGLISVKSPAITTREDCQHILLQCLSQSSFAKKGRRTTTKSTLSCEAAPSAAPSER
jgi:hypothetical protein